jgi:hypothetical protein
VTWISGSRHPGVPSGINTAFHVNADTGCIDQEWETPGNQCWDYTGENNEDGPVHGDEEIPMVKVIIPIPI